MLSNNKSTNLEIELSVNIKNTLIKQFDMPNFDLSLVTPLKTKFSNGINQNTLIYTWIFMIQIWKTKPL